jgi:septum formation protein
LNFLENLVRLIATAKADALVEGILKGEVNINAYPSSDNGCGGLLILTGDQVVVAQNKILEKPESIDEARSFVQMYSQNPPSTVGACVITHIPSKVQVVGVERATIHFKPTIASSNLVDRLLEDSAPILSCAGGLMIEHPFVKEHVDNIEGTEDAVMGLSKDLVMTLLHNIKNTLVQSSCQTNVLD